MTNRDEQEIGRIIEENLADILSGKASLGDVLRKHPDLADTLQPELEAALWVVSRKEQVGPRPGFMAASRKRVVEQIVQESQHVGTRRSFLGFPWSQTRVPYQWVVAAILLFMLVTGTGGVLSISQGALPGDQLYSVKRISEEVAFGLTLNEVKKVDLAHQFTERRVEEVEKLFVRGNYSIVTETLVEFEQEVQQSVALLQQVGDGRLEEKSALASEMQVELEQFAERLNALKETAPVEVRASLERARDVSASGAFLASEVLEDVQEEIIPIPNTATPTRPGRTATATTPTGESSREPTPTEPGSDEEPPPVATSTPLPPGQTKPEKTATQTKEPVSPTEVEPTDTSVPDPHDLAPTEPEATEKPLPTQAQKPTTEPPADLKPTKKPLPTQAQKPTAKPTNEKKSTKTEKVKD